MKCEHCGKEIGSEKLVCPFCQTPILAAKGLDSLAEQPEKPDGGQEGKTSAEPGQEDTVPAEPEKKEESLANPGQEDTVLAEPEKKDEASANPEQEDTVLAEPEKKDEASANPEQEDTVLAEPEKKDEAPANPGQEDTVLAEPEKKDKDKAPANPGQEDTVPAEPSEEGEAVAVAVSDMVPVKPKKGRKTAIVAGVVAAGLAAVIGIGVLAAGRLNEKDPKEVVIRAFQNIYTDDQVKPMEELFGISQFQQNAGGSRQTAIELMLEDSTNEDLRSLAGGGIRMEYKGDPENDTVRGDLGLQMNNMDVMNLNVYYGGETLMVAVPELSSRVFMLDVSEGVAERMQASPVLGPMLEESDVDVEELTSFFTEYAEWMQEQAQMASDPETMEGVYGLWNRYKKGCQAREDFKAVLTVEKGDKAKFEIDGKTVSCKGYRVHVSKDSMISFLRTTSDFFLEDEGLRQYYLESLKMSYQAAGLGSGVSGSIWDDLSPEEMLQRYYDEAEKTAEEMINQLDKVLNDADMMVYVDKKGRLAAVEGTTDLNAIYSGDDSPIQVSFGMNLRGGSYLTQNAGINIELKDEKSQESVVLDIAKTGSYDGKTLTGNMMFNFQMTGQEPVTLELDGNYHADGGDFAMKADLKKDQQSLFLLSMDGIVSELEKGSVFHTDVDELKLTLANELAEGIIWDEEFSLSVSGSYDVRPLSGPVEEPEGEKFDIVAATEDEWSLSLIHI